MAKSDSWHAPGYDLCVQLIQRSLAARVIQWVDEIRDVDGYRIVKFKQLQHAVWWPAALPLHHLWVVADEQLNPRHWHRYESHGTEIKPSDVVLDCGASEGLFALTIAGRCRHVHLVEPSPLYRSALLRTFAEFRNVSIHAVGLGATADRVAFQDSGVTSGFDERAKTGVEIPIVTADDFFENQDLKPSFIKADIEGWELAMLQGAAKLLAGPVRQLAVTVYHTPKNDYRQISAFLAGCNPGFRFRFSGVGDRLDPHGRPVPIVMHVGTE